MINNLNILLPEIFLSLSIFSILMLGVFIKKSFNIVFNLTSIILVITTAIILNNPNNEEKIFLDSFVRDNFSNYLKLERDRTILAVSGKDVIDDLAKDPKYLPYLQNKNGDIDYTLLQADKAHDVPLFLSRIEGRNKKYKDLYESDERFNYISGTSEDMSKEVSNIGFFYIDGLHDTGTVIRDVLNLESVQTSNEKPIWVFDDFDVRFGCANDIMQLLSASAKFKVYKVGLTASGKPSHQAIAIANYRLG